MKEHKLKAFTLAEMLIVLVVASILISMGFLFLNMVRKQVQLIQRNYAKKQEVRLFEARFSRDFNTRSVCYYKQQHVFVLKNSKDSICYAFLNNAVVREKDTFFIAVANKKMFLEGSEVTEKTIDAIEINFSDQFANKQLFIYQVKDAAHYLN